MKMNVSRTVLKLEALRYCFGPCRYKHLSTQILCFHIGKCKNLEPDKTNIENVCCDLRSRSRSCSVSTLSLRRGINTSSNGTTTSTAADKDNTTGSRTTKIIEEIVPETDNKEVIRQNNFDAKSSESEEDFFGIPQNFKLQHARLETKSKNAEIKLSDTERFEQSKKDYVLTELADKDKGDSNLEYALSRKERRQIQTNEFKTHFGIVSFDSRATGVTGRKNINLASKAKEIHKRQDSKSLKKEFSDNQKLMNASQNNNSNNYFPERNTHLKSSPFVIDSSSYKDPVPHNYFDETFFPELVSTSSNKDKNFEEQRESVKTNITPDKQKTIEPDVNSASYFDEQYFGSQIKSSDNSNKWVKTNITSDKKESAPPSSSSSNYVDEQYFGSDTINNRKSHSISGLDHESLKVLSSSQKDDNLGHSTDQKLLENDFNEVDSQYFGPTYQNYSSNEQVDGKSINKNLDKDPIGSSLTDIVHKYTNSSDNAEAVVLNRKRETRTVKHKQVQSELDPTNRLSELNSEKSVTKKTEMGSKHNSSIKKEQATTENTDKPTSAYELAMKFRQELRMNKTTKEKKETPSSSGSINNTDQSEKLYVGPNVHLDSKGFRILDNQTIDFSKMTSADVLTLLKKRIIFDHEDFVAIDKPYGLPSVEQQNDRVSVTQLLPSFASSLHKSLKTDKLHLVQALDRDVSGAIILAKNPEVASVLRGMYDNCDEVIQRFWAITKGVPNPLAGVIDIPVGEGKIGNIRKMVLRPRFSKTEKLIAKVSEAPSAYAVTEYKVLCHHLQAALVECTQHTNGVKHQVRVHLASGLNTPILGDHKYSNFATLAPQKLHKEMLELLRIRQAKVRHLVLHLHCRTVVLTNYKGRMIFLTTNAPPHFKDNMKSLRLYAPKK